MDEIIRDRTVTTVGARDRSVPAYQAYQVLHLAFVVAPLLAGVDKFFHVMTNWDQYLAPQLAALIPAGLGAHRAMLVVGVIEICASVIVALKPKVGAWVVAAWLGGIICNLLLAGGFLDIALRDVGLLLGAVALGRLAMTYDRPHLARRRVVERA